MIEYILRKLKLLIFEILQILLKTILILLKVAININGD
jgi:hypothetical protein